MVPDTVQLMVEVAGLCAQAPALEMMRPAGIAPCRKAHRNFSLQCSRSSGVVSISANACATRRKVQSMDLSIICPSLAWRRYFLSQMSHEAGCIGTSVAMVELSTGLRCAVFMGQESPR